MGETDRELAYAFVWDRLVTAFNNEDREGAEKLKALLETVELMSDEDFDMRYVESHD